MLAVASFAQSGPPGGGSGQMDGNPWNPANWDMQYETIREDAVQLRGWKTINGEIVADNNDYDWAMMPQMEYITRNLGEGERSVSASSTGTIVKKIKWVSPYGNAPARILVQIQSAVKAGSSDLNPNIGVSNGLGSPATVATFFMPDDGQQSYGPKLKWVEIESNGVGTIEVSQSSHAYGQVPESGYAGVDYPNLSVELADWAVGIQSWLGPTFYAKPVYSGPHIVGYVREMNDLSDPSDYRIDTVAQFIYNSQGAPFISGAEFKKDFIQRDLFGSWQTPWQKIFNPGHTHLFQNYGILERIWSSKASVANLMDSPALEEIEVTQTMMNGESRFGRADVIVHAEYELYDLGEEYLETTDWVGIGGVLTISPLPYHQSRTLEATSGVVHTSTVDIGTEFGSDLTLGLKDLIGYKVGGVFSTSMGQSAALSVTLTESWTISGVFDEVVSYQWKRRAFFKSRDMYVKIYGHAGFLSTAVLKGQRWNSETKHLAETSDFESRVFEVPTP